jgi:CRISPR-associated endonuclease/helicase Cas3
MHSTLPPTEPASSRSAHWATLPSLYAAEFAEFCEAAHDIKPYPWQMHLAQTVFESRQWPRKLSLPCVAGRCLLVDIAIFHLALEAEARGDRQAPLRIAHILDRWTIQNSFFDHATQLAERLNSSLGSSDHKYILTRVARRLTFLGGSDLPLVVSTLAAGAPQEGDWTPSASQPAVVCSLVDTIGSRLLFRGYGVSAAMNTLHAGLFGADCLLILDDTRDDAFRQTLSAVNRLRDCPWTTCARAPWSVVDVKVARSRDSSVLVNLSDEDRKNPQLARRLNALKPAKLSIARARSTNTPAHAEELIDQAWSMSGYESGARGRTVGIVVNTITLARACASAIASRITGRSDLRSLLLIGRARPVERARRMRNEVQRLVHGDAQCHSTLFVIATQCIEAGADYDFDLLVTQIAPIDALQQRFARLNRRGHSGHAEAIILACRDEINSSARDAIYGEATRNTWM